MASLDLAWIRGQFPALTQEVANRPAVFFDGPGGTQVPQRVIDAVSTYFVSANANTHGAFLTSRRSDEYIVAAHAGMADLLGCDPDEVVFGHNMTTLTFALSRSFGREIKAGDEILLTRLDHDANVAPWMALAEQGAVIRFVDVDTEDCTLDMDDLQRQLGPRTRLVAFGFASNAVGTINDVAEITRLAHAAGALVYIDAVHYAPHGPIDVRALDVDFLACSPYKFFAPHMGALYGKREHLERLHPYKVRPAADTIPDRWETGTKNHEGLAGVAAAIDYLADLGAQVAGTTTAGRRDRILTAMEAIKAYERELSVKLIEGLLAVPGLTFYGISDPARFDWRTPTVSFRMAGYTPQALADYLGERGIFAWNGNYYALNLSQRLGVEDQGGMLRIGLVHYNTAEEVDRLLQTLHEL
ncbi:MAG TPA: cysteine desulfurase-like protein [Roseiflexaceae bacterium]|nr:cysteine desulfurase-like protein [Roseiflexaceae bacterium]HMP40771.1 cysteine desulfurase-like protein [Roseiflexaceae bacterium]